MDPNLQPQGRYGRSPVEPVDLDPARRPGVPKERKPEPWPNSRFPPQRMTAPSATPKHGRPDKPMPPVYSTAVPPRGLSGALRRSAYRRADHQVSHWMMLLFADRVDSWETRAKRVLPLAVPLVGIGTIVVRELRGRRR